MRLLFVSSDFLPDIGGISLMVHGLAEACAELGHDVTVLAPAAPAHGDSLPYRVLRDRRSRPTKGRRIARLLFRLGSHRTLESVVTSFEPDAIILGVYKDYYAACFAVRKSWGVPVAGLAHGLEILGATRRKAGPFRRILSAVGYKSARENVLTYLRDADCIFANSSVTSDHVERISGRKAVTIGCGVPHSLLSKAVSFSQSLASRASFRERLGLGEAPTIGYLGRLIARKNVESVLRSLQILDDVNALIVGDGPSRADLEVLAKALRVDDRVTFTGQVPEEAKLDYLRAMDVFCMPSKTLERFNFEGFGIVFLEASAAGVPVVGGRSGGIPDVVHHEETGLLADPDDWKDVSQCLRRLLNDPQLSDRCVTAAQAQLRTKYNWPSIAQQILTHLDQARTRTITLRPKDNR